MDIIKPTKEKKKKKVIRKKVKVNRKNDDDRPETEQGLMVTETGSRRSSLRKDSLYEEFG